MRQITNQDELTAWDKIYLIQTAEGVQLANWTPKHGEHFTTKNHDVVSYYDVYCIVELCDDIE